jgi:hypothetical protein
MIMENDGTIVITGPERIEGARILAVRSALKLETKGLKRRGRSARQLANDITGHNNRTAVKAYASLNTYIVEHYGQQFDNPL